MRRVGDAVEVLGGAERSGLSRRQEWVRADSGVGAASASSLGAIPAGGPGRDASGMCMCVCCMCASACAGRGGRG
eukprot:scaffold12973_cov117-Isochrysis_galbana.AAC.9